jgi:hypothetical protein
MNKILLIVLLGFSSSGLWAQKISLSEKEEFNYRTDDFMAIGSYKNYHVAYINHLNLREVIFYNAQFVKEKVSTLNFLPSSFSKLTFLVDQHHLNAIYVSEEKNQMTVYASALNEDNTWTQPIAIDSTSGSSYRNGNEYHLVHSLNQSKLLIYHTYLNKGTYTLHANVLDLDLHTVSIINQEFTESNFDISEEAVVSNEGAAFILASDIRIAKANRDQLFLLHAAPGDTHFGSLSLDLKHYSISDFHLACDDINKTIYTCGYFSDGHYSYPRGIYFSVFDIGSDSLSAGFFTPLTLQISSAHTDLKDLKIRNLFLKKTGELEIVAEKSYQNTRSIGAVTPMFSNSMGNTITENMRTVQEYSNDEIVMFTFKTDGSMAWNQSVLKDQTTTDDNGIFSSYGVLQHRMGTVYFFNDMSAKKNRLLASYISGNGELTVKELQTSEDIDEWNLMPRSLVQVSDSEIIMPCMTKGYICFLKISY